jgi:oxygen-dependent protoporphyrinogen oxidase
MLGGACFPHYLNLSDLDITDRVKADLKTIMGIKAPPAFSRIYRHDKAIPQYTVGHPQRVELLWQKLREHPGLFLTGNSYRGIGLNDCVAAAHRAVTETMAHLARR